MFWFSSVKGKASVLSLKKVMTNSKKWFRIGLRDYFMTEDFIMKALNYLVLILVIVSALNWGLWGFFQFDLVAWLFGGNTTGLSRLVYGIVGVAGVWSLSFLGKCRCMCSSCGCGCNKGDKSGGGCCNKM